MVADAGRGRGLPELGRGKIKTDVPIVYHVQYRKAQMEPEPSEPAESPEETMIRRSLEENRFWLRIMKEHSLFLSDAFDRRDSPLIRRANMFFEEFDRLLREAEALQPRSPEQMAEFNERAIARTADLRTFKQDVLVLIITGRIAGFNLPLLVDHIRREAEYFIMTLTRINKGIDDPVEAEIVRENIFWLRIMADHSRFIRSLLDPSERRLIAAANQFAGEFDKLLAQARDLGSMVAGASPALVIVGGHMLDEVSIVRLREADERSRENAERQNLTEPPPPALATLNQNAIRAAEEIRDFKRQATVLVSEARVLSVINPLLADHVTREAEKFLGVLNMIERRIRRTFEPVRAVSNTEPAPPCDDDEAQPTPPPSPQT